MTFTDTGTGVKTVTLGNGNNKIDLALTTGANVVNTGSGLDFLKGGGGADFINAGAGNDVILGNLSTSASAANTLIGGDGADYIQGQAAATVYTSGPVATYTDVIFTGSKTTGTTVTSGSWTGVLYAEGTDTITTTGLNSTFAALYTGSPFIGTFAPIFNAANIVDGWFGADTIVASTAKDVFLFQTGIAATTEVVAASRGAAISGKTIEHFRVGTDAIAVTNYVGGADNVFVGSALTATAFNVTASPSSALLASTSGWTWTPDSGKTDAGTLAYVGAIGSSNQTYANMDIHLVGVQGTGTGTNGALTVNDFFYSGAV